MLPEATPAQSNLPMQFAKKSYTKICPKHIVLPFAQVSFMQYHDLEYGFLITDDNLLFERLILEINQAGLSWEIILKKRQGFRAAYANFVLEQVAAFTLEDEIRLLSDTGIIRNKLKVKAAIENAKRILRLQHQYGSFSIWLERHRGLDLPEWKKLFKQTFVFTGGEIVNEFLVSLGYLGGAHDSDCFVGQQLKK